MWKKLNKVEKVDEFGGNVVKWVTKVDAQQSADKVSQQFLLKARKKDF